MPDLVVFPAPPRGRTTLTGALGAARRCRPARSIGGLGLPALASALAGVERPLKGRERRLQPLGVE
eukprot:8122040-Alexandrium_andersonii.AAC.1